MSHFTTSSLEIEVRPGTPSSARVLAVLLTTLASPAFAFAALGAVWVAGREAVLNGYLEADRLPLAVDLLSRELHRNLALVLAAAVILAPVVFVLRRRGWHGPVLWIGSWICELLLVVLSVGFASDWRVWQDWHGRILPRIVQRPGLLLTFALLAALVGVAALVFGRPGKSTTANGWPSRRLTRGSGCLFLVVLLGVLGVHGAVLWLDLGLPPRPHPVVWISWDSVRADHLSAYRHPHPTSPNLDAFARDAVLFERAYSQHNWTRPSYTSILTSMFSWQVPRKSSTLPKGALHRAGLSLAEILRGRGYRTVAYVQNPNLDARLGFDQGFDEYIHIFERDTPEHISRFVLPRLAKWARSTRPLFLFVHVQEPHYPYRPLARTGDPPLSRKQVIDLMWQHGKTWDAEMPRAREILRYLHDGYDGDLRAADKELGRLLRALETTGLGEETLLIFNSDHGDEFFDRDSFGHGHDNVHAELTHIPLIFRFPRSLGVAPRRVKNIVRNLDLAPTVLDVLGLTVPGAMVGRSVLPLESLDHEPRLAVSTTREHLALRRDGRSVIATVDEERAKFFSLGADPGERQPLAEPLDDAEFERLRGEVRRWLGLHKMANPIAGTSVEEGLEKRLRALGYVN